MNAVEIEEAISALAEQPFDAQEFPFAFLQAFGNKETTIKRLRKGESNKSDRGGVLQTNNIHIAVAALGEVSKTLSALKASPATARAKAKFALATDGETFEAEDLASGETIACAYVDFPNHFGFFLPLAGITTVKQIRENAFDIRATSRLNRLYLALRKDNPDWDTAERRMRARFAAIGDPHANMDEAAGSLDMLLDLAARNEKAGLAVAPWPPHFRKMEGEASRVAPSKAKPRARKTRERMPLLVVANSSDKDAALGGLDRWKARHPEAAGHLAVDDVLVDSMRGRSSTWIRIRVNLRNVPEAIRPRQEPPDRDDDPTQEWRERHDKESGS